MAISTNKDYLTAKLAKFGLSENDIDLILAENPDLGEGFLDPKACNLAMYNSFSTLIPASSVSEGGYSVSWNIEHLKMFYNSLCTELGKPNVLKPKIRNRSNYW